MKKTLRISLITAPLLFISIFALPAAYSGDLHAPTNINPSIAAITS